MTAAGTSFPIERFTLDNGLRVVVSPDHHAPVVAVVVLYDVGVRAEPAGRAGYAHLCEHLMFQGSERLPRHAYVRLVQGAGGRFRGSTHMDFTHYSVNLPVRALEQALYLEADRMRGPVLTEANLRNQVAVVQEEIRTRVLNRPYGGFPWRQLAPVLFHRFPNTHDGLGSIEDLELTTVDRTEKFFQTYYVPANAVLAVVGDLDPDRTRQLVWRHFGDLPLRPPPPPPVLTEPDLARPRLGAVQDQLAPRPALAVGWRVPDPIRELTGYLPYVVLADLLTGGPTGRLVRRLVMRERLATSVRCHLGFTDEPFGVRDPTALVLRVRLSASGSAERVLAAVDDELATLAGGALTDREVQQVRARTVAGLLRDCDPVLERGLTIAVLELQRGQPELLNCLPNLVSSVTTGDLAAAATLASSRQRAAVEVSASAGR
jgi:zinc protease